MEISIDLKLMREIVFKDELLLKEMLDEWKIDSNSKITEIKKRFMEQDNKGLYNKIHELKTNFSMLHCGEAIRFCESIIKKIETENPVVENEIRELDAIVLKVNSQLNI